MKMLKKAASLILAGIIILQANTGLISYADTLETQKPPEKLSVSDIGYNKYDKYYADLTFSYPSNFFVVNATGTYLNFYYQEVAKGYKAAGTRTLKEGAVPADASTTTYRMKELNSGTIYYADITAYYKYANGSATLTSTESVASNRVKFMTDIDVEAYSVSSDQIKVEWDDVWDTDGRINYKLYISDSSDFKNTAPKYIEPDDIGVDKPVQVDQTTGKLSYTHTVDSAGKVYYIKVVPVITDDSIEKYPTESNTIMVSSYILAKTTKVSSNDDGTIWRLDWSPVIVGLSDSNIDVSYEVYKGKTDSTELPGRIQTLTNTSMYIILTPGEELTTYYVIRALVTRDGEDVYPGITIESDKIMMKDEEVAYNPPTPELVDTLGGVTGGEDGVTATSATILWNIPKTIEGDVDYDTAYDVWITTNPDDINDSEALGDPISWGLKDGAYKIAEGSLNFTFDFVRDSTNILGCRLDITGLNQNTSYYFKIQARKSFMEYVDEVLQLVPYSSEPALQTIVTPVGGDISTPTAPQTPPFKVKEHPEGTPLVSDTAITLQIKNRWYEQYNSETNKWAYIETENYIEGTTVPPFDEIDGTNFNNFRMQLYADSTTINIYYTKYVEGTDYSNMDIEGTYDPTVVAGFSTAANDDYENVKNNYPDFKYKRNVDLPLTGLEHNTTYVIWVKAFNGTTSSEPSDPIIVTTDPTDTSPVETPPVPVFNYSSAGDVYVDLGWDYNDKYKYYIKYSNVENETSASGTIAIDNLGDLNYYRISGLTKNTIYYFWIQAEYTNSIGESAKSSWSDPYSVKTSADIVPDTPTGFGIKTTADAITKDSITYEWLLVDSMEYILEIATNSDYTDAATYSAGAVSEYKVEGLKSNVRYYARLYAYNPDNQLKSTPTGSVAVKTLKSDGEYDSGSDTDSQITGDYVIKGTTVVGGVWYIKITGVNADRLIEHIKTDNVLDYTLDASNPPTDGAILNILVSARVFGALNKMKENLIILADGGKFIIRPGVLNDKTPGGTTSKEDENLYEITINAPGKTISESQRNLTFKTGSIGFSVIKHANGNTIDIGKLGKPLQIFIPYTDKAWYKLGTTIPYEKQTDEGTWNKLSAISAVYDPDQGEGYLGFESYYPGNFAVADKGNEYFDDIYGTEYESSISNVVSAYELKSVKGTYFKPDAYIATGDAVKIMFDVLEYNYGNNYISVAIKSGIIKSSNSKSPGSSASREAVIAMAVRAYEIKSGESAKPSTSRVNEYSDMYTTDSLLLAKVRFAYQNGMLPSDWSKLSPKGRVTRGETMFILEKALILAGDID